MKNRQNHCDDCEMDLSRRDFVKVAGAAAVAASAIPAQAALAQPSPKSPAETVVKRFYDSLSPNQRKAVCLPFNHQKRSRISANWHVVETDIGDDFYSLEQREMIKDILKKVTSEDGYERLLKQMDEDDGGIGAYSCAIFGKPGDGQFQWTMTGRHLTIRADGNTLENMAFGGPLVYGHGEEEARSNLFYYQTQEANKVFDALDPKQRQLALLQKAPGEARVPLQGEKGKFPGLSVSEMSDDQKKLVEQVIRIGLAPYRQQDVDEAIKFIKSGGDFAGLSMAFYQQNDLDNDKVWDIWRVEGPNFVWHFRGAPHVHAYVHVGMKS